MRICLRRREFIAGLGGAAAWRPEHQSLKGQAVPSPRRVQGIGVPDVSGPATVPRCASGLPRRGAPISGLLDREGAAARVSG